jgi:hypothetical protein
MQSAGTGLVIAAFVVSVCSAAVTLIGRKHHHDVGYGAMTLTHDPNGPAVYRSTLDATLADTRARDIVTYLSRAPHSVATSRSGAGT